MARTRSSGVSVGENIDVKDKAAPPTEAVKRPHGRPSKAPIDSPGSSSTPTPTTDLSGSEYTTPLTSNVATPAPIDALQQPPSTGRLNRIEVRLPIVKASARSHGALRQSIYSMSSKRKRVEIDDSEDDDSDCSPDAKLARKLQDEEDKEMQAKETISSRQTGSGLRRSLRGLASSPAVTPFTVDEEKKGEVSLAVQPATRSRVGLSKSLKTKALPITTPGKKRTIIADSDEDGDVALSESLEESDSDDSLQPLSRRRKRPLRQSAVKARPLLANNEKSTKAQGAETLSEDDSDVDLAFSDSDDSDAPSVAEDGSGGSGSDVDAGSELDAHAEALRTATSNRRAFRGYRSKKRVQKDRDRLEGFHPELKTMWKDLQDMPVLKAGKAEQPKSISRQLKPFQLEGLAWMKEMEKIEWKGGLLGDEMGLGKTIQAVSLIMSDWPAKKPSLVLVPPVALMQWQTEIDSYTDGTLKTLVCHGTNAKSKNLTMKDVKKYDVIIMSYNSLESMYRKQEKGFKRKDGLFKEKSVIHQTVFHRVILDEAHSIKTRSTMTAKACFALQVEYRWCLTGTPLQNRIGEFFSLIRFLNIRPFSCYLCKQCSCSMLEWTMDEDNKCKGCHHSGMQHVSVFNQELLNPIQKYGNTGKGRIAFQNLRIMTDRIMLRRLKKDHMDSMELPVKEINVERQFFGEVENDFANSIMTSGQRKFDTYVASGVLLNNYANIFGLIMQMRQVADHPDLILKKNSEGGQNVLVCNICDEPAEDAIRSRCKHDFCRACAKSYLNSSPNPNCPQCHIPLSMDLEQPEIEQDEALVKKSSIINRIKMENWTSSSKIELLVHELHRLRSDNTSHKSIIFSQFTTMLQLIEWRLRRAGITTVMLDGSMTPAQRQASIEHFMRNVDVECFLVSLKAGGVALNLTEASRVFIVDPWWNPAAEWQSADRCHRIGQTRPCSITRLCIEDSVESRMVLLQEKKTNMINSTINSDDAAMDSLSPEDLQFLFRGT
ncbi:SNF2 family N-terminal domain-containing protein [Lasiosphaeria miniovina]|uniref:SNF2 family N-terminal domain-containing protein n=1 Tax=Lasiosphaeria miniovina TaxID=1954250 RepID=A0AA40E4Y0_9PEZI|nr:SNF2 family N-terminal domain-containing protein [Lasiosphaeria miniovina]KAK0727235.1 SNF2 family N-terminal domain-containing protein [Lasiosphaeria miniovina]